MVISTVLSILGVLGLIATFWVLYEVWFVKKQMSTQKRIIWSIVAILLSILAAILYYILEKN